MHMAHGSNFALNANFSDSFPFEFHSDIHHSAFKHFSNNLSDTKQHNYVLSTDGEVTCKGVKDQNAHKKCPHFIALHMLKMQPPLILIEALSTQHLCTFQTTSF